ncbi:Gfo/Idh/MocA family oxidoreductase [bacterium AH-315-C07]|nr:Gfo/Idh/MocA family oxidoreductase [bacterium AH-315-C07]
MKINKAIIIGYGHHAKRRLLPSLLKFDQIENYILYDINENQFDQIGESNILTTTDLKKVISRIDESTLVVVGTTAKDHHELILMLSQAPLKYLYLEKPIAQSTRDTDAIQKIILENGIKAVIGIYNDFIPITTYLPSLQQKHSLGELVKISSMGGAVDLSVNGIHIIDLATFLFKSEPMEAIGRINSTIDNPRGQEYKTHGGLGYVRYKNGKELIIHYSNRSLNTYNAVLHFEYGYIESCLDINELVVYGYDSIDVNQPKFRYDVPKLLETVSLDFNFNSLFDRVFNNFIKQDGPFCDINRGVVNMHALLGILISDKTNSPVNLPINQSHKYYETKFPIT